MLKVDEVSTQKGSQQMVKYIYHVGLSDIHGADMRVTLKIKPDNINEQGDSIPEVTVTAPEENTVDTQLRHDK